MGAPEPLYRGCPTVIGHTTGRQARISLVRASEVPPTAHLLLSKRKRLVCRAYRRGKEAEVWSFLATKIVSAYVAANNG